jgi:hypothetical protein
MEPTFLPTLASKVGHSENWDIISFLFAVNQAQSHQGIFFGFVATPRVALCVLKTKNILF